MKNEKAIKKLEKGIANIQEQIEKLKNEKPEIGSWYKRPLGTLLCITDNKELLFGYGFSASGDWTNNDYAHGQMYKEWTPATDKEVEAALIAEAKKRGFKEGVNVKGYSYTTCGHIYKSEFENWLVLGVACGPNIVIFQEGNWAEIIEEPKVLINGEEMKQDNIYVSFGCAKFQKMDFKEMQTLVDVFNHHPLGECNRKIASFTLDSGVEITIEELKQIVNEIK